MQLCSSYYERRGLSKQISSTVHNNALEIPFISLLSSGYTLPDSGQLQVLIAVFGGWLSYILQDIYAYIAEQNFYD